MPYNPDDLGLDLLHAAALPECGACRKKSDGGKSVREGLKFTVLCGTHLDEWMRMKKDDPHLSAADFAQTLRLTRYKSCWDAKLEE